MSSSRQKRGPWSQLEDDILMHLVQTQGAFNWVRTSQLIKTRTAKQCRERYHQNLKPSLKHFPITPEEGMQIEQLVRQFGKRWAEIARMLPGRSDNAVKNWWNGSQNRRRRMDNRQAVRAGAVPFGCAVDMSAAADRRSSTTSSSSSSSISFQRTLTGRPLPPPIAPAAFRDRNYGFETPLPSPGIHSPVSDVTPSVSDCGSYYATSPGGYSTRSPDARLRPFQTQLLPSPRASSSPTDTKLPSLRTITSPMFGNAELSQSLPPMVHSQLDYYAPKSHLPTAPNSPVRSSERSLSIASQESGSSTNRIAVNSLLS